MNKFKNSLKNLLLVALIFSLLSFNVIKADEPVNAPLSQTALGVEPAIEEIVLDKGVPIQKEINLFNFTNNAVPIKVSKESFVPSDTTNIPKETLKAFDSSAWLSISDQETDFILQPKEVRTITLNITAPEDASPGGHYATLYFEPLVPAEFISKQSVFVYARVAVLVFMQIKGTINENLDVTDFTAQSLVEDNNNINFNVTLRNTGNTHLLPGGKIDIFDSTTNSLIKTITLDDSLLLPGLEKTVSTEYNPGYLIGKLYAKATFNYGSSRQAAVSNRIDILVFPYKKFILLIVILLILYLLRKRLPKAISVLLGREYKSKKSITLTIKTKRKLRLKQRLTEIFRSIKMYRNNLEPEETKKTYKMPVTNTPILKRSKLEFKGFGQREVSILSKIRKRLGV